MALSAWLGDVRKGLVKSCPMSGCSQALLRQSVRVLTDLIPPDSALLVRGMIRVGPYRNPRFPW